jgi:serine/threonine-protein kinase
VTEQGVVMGTAAYMSPEQVRGLAIDPRSDIFSLGAILYEKLAGARAFNAASSIEIIHAIVKAERREAAS